MIFEDGGMVVVQEMPIGGYMAMVPGDRTDAVIDALDGAGIDYELQANTFNVDDMNEDMNTATILTFGTHANIEKIQQVLDAVP